MFTSRNLTVAILIVSYACVGCSERQAAATKGNGERVDLPPGSHGEPPPELRKFVPPIELVNADGYSDFGTEWVVLRDSRGRRLVFCVYQDAYEDDFLGNALYIGATHPRDSSARLPLSDDEARLAVESLKSALAPLQAAKSPAKVDELEAAAVRPADQDETQPLSKRDLVLGFAESVLRRLQNRDSVPLADVEELSARAARLQAVDLDDAAAEFRDREGEDRQSQWERLKPVLIARSRGVQPEDLRAFFVEHLGRPDTGLLKRFESMIVSPDVNMTPIQDDALAFDLGGDDGEYALIVDFRDPQSLGFYVLFGSD